MIKTIEIHKAAEILRNGGLVGMPTETVYGLAADARNAEAVARVFAAKQRPFHHPLIVHLADPSQLNEWTREISPDALKLANAFWPGPLTLVFRKQPHVLASVTGGQDTVAIRIPRHPVAAALLQAFGGGLVAPSANRFTRISPTTAAAVRAELGEAVDLVLDGGPCEVGLESTIIDMSGSEPRILRPGMISPQQIAAVLGKAVQVTRQDHPGETRAPGMHHLHYAPKTRTEMLTTQQIQDLIISHEVVVCLTHSGVKVANSIQQVKMPDDPNGYAHALYSTLRAQDQNQYQRIIIEAVPDDAEWDAIRDRLNKATGSLSS